MAQRQQVKPKTRAGGAMPSVLRSVQRSVTVASAAVDTAFASSTTPGGTLSSSASAVERHSLLANDGMTMDAPRSSPDRGVTATSAGLASLHVDPGAGAGAATPGKAPKAPKLQKMSSRHIKMKSVLDSISTRLKLQSHGDKIGFGGKRTSRYGGRGGEDASGKSYNVEIPKNMLVLTLVAFFVMPLAFGLWVLFRQLFMSDETHSRYANAHHGSHGHGNHPLIGHAGTNGAIGNVTATEAWHVEGDNSTATKAAAALSTAKTTGGLAEEGSGAAADEAANGEEGGTEAEAEADDNADAEADETKEDEAKEEEDEGSAVKTTKAATEEDDATNADAETKEETDATTNDAADEEQKQSSEAAKTKAEPDADATTDGSAANGNADRAEEEEADRTNADNEAKAAGDADTEAKDTDNPEEELPSADADANGDETKAKAEAKVDRQEKEEEGDGLAEKKIGDGKEPIKKDNEGGADPGQNADDGR